VLKLTGQFTVQQMLHRENFKKRMEAEQKIMVSEFLYPIMQAYDSVVIKADVELGGTDQTFNNLCGRDLMPRYGLEAQVVMIMPILVGLDGQEKMSKSKGNYVGVTDQPDDMFGKLMSIPDLLMPNYYRLLTDLPQDRITSLMDGKTTHPRDAKDILARIIVEEMYDRDAANQASAEFRRRFTEHALPTDLEIKTVTQSPIGIVALVSSVGFAASNSEARRLVEQGAVSVGGAKISDPKATVSIDGEVVLQVGKRRVCKVVKG
jgi:tyrosyl-tRNA synthetase